MPTPYSQAEAVRAAANIPAVVIQALSTAAIVQAAIRAVVIQLIADGTIGGGGSGGATTSALISDSGAAGRDVVKAATAADVRTAAGLGNVNNTSDLAKPISTATQAALNAKADTGLYAFAENPTMLETYKFGGTGPSFVTADTDGTLPDAVAANYITPDQLAAAISPNAGVRSITYNGATQTGNVVITAQPGGNLYSISGATAARVNPLDGTPLPAGSVVFWFADSQPYNMAAGDKWLNNPDL